MREAAAIHAAWGGIGHRLTVQIHLDALEVAVLLGADPTPELQALSEAESDIDPQSAHGCR